MLLEYNTFNWGLCPQTPRVYRIMQKNEEPDRSERSVLMTSPSFLCPTQALRLALQHHLILLVGILIFMLIQFNKSSKNIMRHLSSFRNMFHYTIKFLNACPANGNHFIRPHVISTVKHRPLFCQLI